ncbi:LOW QUALITY PROTEIN: hypothetical protein Cgig2_021279 [Carnegiea gigantea]|uniref:Uncharacterized protein n=1 Tax=Carnegiea gigantea TaxID=171969 RepID=A0A9Q1GLM3_9CARY|nr:LOW QUALITY PROTEIN: hypothetical protein Cgig2_021279 [Carnegiea gigantea]
MGLLAMKGLHSKMVKNVTIDLIIDVQVSCKVLTPIQASYWEKELGANLPILRLLNLYDKSDVMDQTKPLKQVGIFGAIGVSQFLYHFETNCPLTNTFHHGAGEVGISLYDFEQIGGLPTLGVIYEEFLPPNKVLADHNKYPTTAVKLLHIHAELCEFHKVKHIYYDPYCFVLPYVLGYICHGIGEAASHPDHPGKANVLFPSHYIIGWLAKLFPYSYRRHPDSDCLGDFSTLIPYAGLLGSKLSLPHARHVFRDGRYLSLRGRSYCEDSRNSQDVIDMGLLDEDFKFLLSIRGLRQQKSVMDLHKPTLIFKASRAQVSQSLSALRSMIDIYNLSTIEICWLSSKIEEIFGIVETAVKSKELLDVDRLCLTKISLVLLKLIILKVSPQLNNLSNETSKHKEILKEDKRIRKMRENLTIQQQSLIKAKSKLKSSLYLKKREVQ